MRPALIAILYLALLGFALWFPPFRIAVFLLLFPAIFLVVSRFTVAGRTTRSLQVFRGAYVRVAAWGSPLPESDAAASMRGSSGPLYVESITSLGVGLLIRLRVASAATPVLLKIAQPRDVVVSADRLIIGRAAYVQWSGRRLKRTTDAPGPALILERVTPADSAETPVGR